LDSDSDPQHCRIGSAFFESLDPDPHFLESLDLDPDPHFNPETGSGSANFSLFGSGSANFYLYGSGSTSANFSNPGSGSGSEKNGCGSETLN